ncbi:hypothetical protein MXZ29_07525 [Streptococcus uberis]|nr:hypothetical protein [Streptococcus uberis]MCK1198709.1 hypothetical protein [Streptococcus uberis]MCK1246434.1 hypothetical protein [Streptococcus uberis]
MMTTIKKSKITATVSFRLLSDLGNKYPIMTDANAKACPKQTLRKSIGKTSCNTIKGS